MRTAAAAGIRHQDGRADAGNALATPAALAPRDDVVHVFQHVGELLDGLDERTADVLRRRATVRREWVDRGAWEPSPSYGLRAGFGLLVIEGLLVRTLDLDGRRCPELVGRGDVLRPWEESERTSDCKTSWTALERTQLAVLDERFARVVCRWPIVMSNLLRGSVERSRSLAFHLAIAHVRHADVRLGLLLWHLADRWGRAGPDGVHLPLALTHEVLAQLACMRRPTASSALQRLARRGDAWRRADGTWMLAHRGPPAG